MVTYYRTAIKYRTTIKVCYSPKRMKLLHPADFPNEYIIIKIIEKNNILIMYVFIIFQEYLILATAYVIVTVAKRRYDVSCRHPLSVARMRSDNFNIITYP